MPSFRKYSIVEQLIMRYSDELPDTEIAKKVGMTESYVRWKRHRMGIWTHFDSEGTIGVS